MGRSRPQYQMRPCRIVNGGRRFGLGKVRLGEARQIAISLPKTLHLSVFFTLFATYDGGVAANTLILYTRESWHKFCIITNAASMRKETHYV